MNEGGSSFNSKILPNRTCIFQEKKRRGNSLRNVNIKGQSIIDMSTKKFRRMRKWPKSTRTIKTTRKVKRLLETFVTKNHDIGFRFIKFEKMSVSPFRNGRKTGRNIRKKSRKF